ncbi:MAG TPA: PmoA family protein, partial [Prolixibacteraceae bacterium]|nr:PmoA family protein [Prolixibacteraceae bacterium]
VADGWHLQNFVQEIDEVEFKNSPNGNGIFSYTSYWKSPNKPNDPFIQEQTQVNIYPRQLNYRRIDFTIQLRALEHGLQLGGADNEKGYGGFSIRLKTNDNTIFTDIDNNTITPTELAIVSDRFIDISNKKQKSGVSIIVWEQNPGTSKWILRQAKSAQNAAWPGREPIEISVTQPTVLKYTLIIHKGKRKAIPIKYLLKESSK